MTQNNQANIVGDTIAKGVSLFEQRGRSVGFKFASKECSVWGQLNIRQDWAEVVPGVMPIIEQVSFSPGVRVSSTYLHEDTERSARWYLVLQERLLPEKIFQYCERTGCSITSYRSKPLGILETGSE